MEPKFWQERWARNQIGFHLPEVNPYLLRYWPSLTLAQGAKVLVPLCGKSLDLMWLASNGYHVLGVELSEQAVDAFFREQNLTPRITWHGVFKVYQADLIEIWCGDFFALDAGALADCTALYDRAALIALPPLKRAVRRAVEQPVAAGLPGAADHPGLRPDAKSRPTLCGDGR